MILRGDAPGHILPFDDDASAVCAAHPRQRIDQLGLSIALHASHAQDLAASQAKADAFDSWQATIIMDMQVEYAEDLIAGRRCVFVDLQDDIAPDHQRCSDCSVD